MEDSIKVKFIFHCKMEKRETFLLLNETMKKIEGKEIEYEFSDIKFSPFEYSIPTRLYILNELHVKVKDYTLNLMKGRNNYHFFSYSNPSLFELIFYKEENLKICVRDEEIKEYDEYSNFKRFSFINIDFDAITIKEAKIRLYRYLPISEKGNSYQFSFYDIKNKYIVSKRIISIMKRNFQNFYQENIDYLTSFSHEIDKIKRSKNSFKEDIDELSFFLNMYNKLNESFDLMVTRERLRNILCEEAYFEFFYLYVKMQMFFTFYKFEDEYKDLDSFIKLYDYVDKIYTELKEEKKLEIFEKITIILNLAAIFLRFKSCDSYLKASIHYIKTDKVEKNSVIDLAMKFLINYISNVDEESPSFFKLVEINSGMGYYNNEKVFTFDMIPLSTLKSHLRGSLPTIITFYTLKETNNLSMIESIIGGISVNEAKIFGEYEEKLKLDIYYPNEKISKIKDISMKLVLNLKHECFGHSKFHTHSEFSQGEKHETPKKCFEHKKLKELVLVNDIGKEDAINILHEKGRSDSGNYYESSFGKKQGTNFYTMTLLGLLNHCGKLIDHPELFYKKEYLEKLQNYVFYKFQFEKKYEKDKKIEVVNKKEQFIELKMENAISNNPKEEIKSKDKDENLNRENNLKEEKNEINLNEEDDDIRTDDIKEEKNEIKINEEEEDAIKSDDIKQEPKLKKKKVTQIEDMNKKEEKDDIINLLDNLDLDQELDYLIKLLPQEQFNITFSQIIKKVSSPKYKKRKKYLTRKRNIPKANNEIKNYNLTKVHKIKKITKYPITYNRQKLITLLANRNIDKKLWNHYLDLYQKSAVYN